MTVDEHADLTVLFSTALKPEKGQKTTIKKLYVSRVALIDACSVVQLRRSLRTSSFIASSEGQKLAAMFMHKIGIEESYNDIRKVLLSAKKSMFGCYGEVIFQSWMLGNAEIREQIEHFCYADMMTIAILGETEIASNFRRVPFSLQGADTMLEPVRKKKHNAAVDPLIARITEPVLWRRLDAVNARVRHSAAIVMLDLYPIRNPEDASPEHNEDLLTRQHRRMVTMLSDACWGIRVDAVPRVCAILAQYWNLVPQDVIKLILVQLVDCLAVDSTTEVRVAVYEGIRRLIECDSALEVVKRLLKKMMKKGVSDKTERVRVAACSVLTALLGHRVIKFWHVLDLEEIIMRLEMDDSETVQRALVHTIFASYMPAKSGQDVIYDRISRLAEFRLAALRFHRFIYPMEMALSEAVDHVTMLTLSMYKRLRYERESQCESTISSDLVICGEMDELVIGGDSVNVVIAQRLVKTILDCAATLWSTMQKDLATNAGEYARIAKAHRKILPHLFSAHKNGDACESVLIMASMLNSSDVTAVSSGVLAHLFHGPMDLDETRLRAYLLAAAAWDMRRLLDAIKDGLMDFSLRGVTHCKSPPAKRSRKVQFDASGRPHDCTIAMRFLQLLLDCETASQQMTSRFVDYLVHFHERLQVSMAIVDAIVEDATLLQAIEDKQRGLNKDDVMRAIYLRQNIAVILLHNTPEGEERDRLTARIIEDLEWFFNICDRFATHDQEGDQLDGMIDEGPLAEFLYQIARVNIGCLAEHLKSWEHDENLHTGLLQILKPVLELRSVPQRLKLLPAALRCLQELLASLTAAKERDEQLVKAIVDFALSAASTVACSADDADAVEASVEPLQALLAAICSSRPGFVAELLERLVRRALQHMCDGNAQNGDIVDPRSEEFKLPSYAHMVIRRLLLRLPAMRRNMMEILRALLQSEEYMVRVEDSVDVFVCRIAAIVQCARICLPMKGQLPSMIVDAVNHRLEAVEGDSQLCDALRQIL